MTPTYLPLFRRVALTEGVTFLFLLAVAMPLKYAAGMPAFVTVAGTVHGIAFIAYCVIGLVVRARRGWGARRSLGALAAGVLPFGPFVFDRSLRREEARVDAGPRGGAAVPVA